MTLNENHFYNRTGNDSTDMADSKPRQIPKQNKVMDQVDEHGNYDDDDDDDLEEDLFNEKLLDIRNTDPDVLGSMEDLEPGLVVVRRNPGERKVEVVEDRRFFSGTGSIVMTTGPTCYAVVTPSSSYLPSPSQIPGRRTTQIDFLQQSEQQQQQLLQQQQQNNSLKKTERNGTFGRK